MSHAKIWLKSLPVKKVTFAGVMPMPFNCRIKEYGKDIDLAAFKDNYDLATFPPEDAPAAAKVLGDLLGKKVNALGNFCSLHFVGANPNVHPARMYGMWGDWDGKPYPENPLFYETWDDKSAEIADGISDEKLACWAKIVEMTGGKAGALGDVIPLHEGIIKYYGPQIADKSCTKTVFSTNAGYNGFKCPMKEVEGGWVPDFTNRYFTEDFPDSFAIYKGIADLVGHPTPTMDECFLWAQKHMGKEYVVGEPGSATLTGKDVKETKAPQAFGITTLNEFLFGADPAA